MEHYIVIGACSLCGCNVTVPRTWHGVQPAPARCEGCHAAAEIRPTIQMKREQSSLTRFDINDMWTF